MTQPEDPRHIGGYEVLGRLGAGGMGVVYQARDRSGRLVALKLVHPELARDADFRERFRGEVARARQVPPFCTAEVLDADPDAPQPYLVVEYVDGPSLAQEVGRNGPLTPANLHAVAIGMATALVAIHEAGVIHRDLKPANVLLAPGSPKVIDFGIARAMEPSAVQVTRTGQIFGSINYMAPERFGAPGVPLTPAADIFAWGCVVAFAGTGRAPFEADSPMATMARILTQPPALDGLPDGPLRRLVERALVTDPARRPNARELLDLLLDDRTLPVAAPVPPAPAAPRPHRRTTAVLAGAVVVLALALTGGAGWVYLAADQKKADPAVPASAPSLPPAPASTSVPADVPTEPVSTRKPAAKPKPKPQPSKSAVRGNQPVIKASDAGGVAGYGPYYLYNLKTRMCADLAGGGGGTLEQPVNQANCEKTSDDNQEWTFVRTGADANGNQLYSIKNVDDGLCLDVPGAGPVPHGTGIMEMACYDQDNQDYRLSPRLTAGGRRYYRVINESSGLCLDVYGTGDGGVDARLTLATCSAGDDHEWALIERSDW